MEITKQLAHVMRDENLFIREVERAPDTDGAGQRFLSRFTVDGKHPYLYENAAIANHVSGTTFLDVCRQLLKAVTHLFYDAPLDNRFVIRTVNMDFSRWVKLNVPIEVIVEMTLERTRLRGDECLNFAARVSYYQEGRLTGTMSGQFSTFSQAVEDLLMGRQYRQSPPAAATCQDGP